MIKADDALKTIFGGKAHGQHVRDDQAGQQAPEVIDARAPRAHGDPCASLSQSWFQPSALSSWRWSAQVLRRPALEHHQREQRVRVVLAAGDVVVDQPRHFCRIEQAARGDALAATADPASAARSSRRSQFFIGMLKPSFLRVRIRSGSTPLHRLLEDPLALAVADLEMARHRERQLHHIAVEKRRARLERRRHAHAIDLHQDVVGQIEAQVGIELPVQQVVLAEARRARRAPARRRRRCRSASRRPGVVEPRLRRAR